MYGCFILLKKTKTKTNKQTKKQTIVLALSSIEYNLFLEIYFHLWDCLKPLNYTLNIIPFDETNNVMYMK